MTTLVISQATDIVHPQRSPVYLDPILDLVCRSFADCNVASFGESSLTATQLPNPVCEQSGSSLLRVATETNEYL